jgi:hypothetical protein
MRSDKLAQILSHGGVHAGSKVLVFESVIGLVVGSLAYRMDGRGEILAPYFGQQPHFDLVDRLNLTHSQMSIIRVLVFHLCNLHLLVRSSPLACSINRDCSSCGLCSQFSNSWNR